MTKPATKPATNPATSPATKPPSQVRLPRAFRVRWLVGFVTALIAPGVLALVWVWDQPWLALSLPVILYGLIPLLDLACGRDGINLSPEQEQRAGRDPFFKALLYLTVPIYAASIYAVLITAGLWINAWASAPAPAGYGGPLATLVLVAGAALFHGTLINVGHELGHSGKKLDRRAAKIANALVGYGHFTLEHNTGHHSRVATPEDCASARFGEGFYAFALREVPGAIIGAVQIEARRLKTKQRAFWHPTNQLLQIWGLSALLAAPLILAFGWIMLPLLALHHLICWLMLTQANYVEHYGLGRALNDKGRYEPVRPIHSWNADQWLSNALLFNLQRHSDHHAHAWRDYQVLRTFDDVPHLPTGYPGTFLLALFPPLWFRVLNPRVEAWAVEHDATINRG